MISLGIQSADGGQSDPAAQTAKETLKKDLKFDPLEGLECDIRDKIQCLTLLPHSRGIWLDPRRFSQLRMLAELVTSDLRAYEKKLYSLQECDAPKREG